MHTTEHAVGMLIEKIFEGYQRKFIVPGKAVPIGNNNGVALVPVISVLLRLKRQGKLVNVDRIVSSFRWHSDSLTVEDRRTNIAESERAKRALLGPIAHMMVWLWEPPVPWATWLAVHQLKRPAQRLAAR